MASEPMMADNNAPAPISNTEEEVSGSESESESGSESESESESEPELTGEVPQVSSIPEIPVNQAPQLEPTATFADASKQQPPNSFNGGRNHYLQSTNKKAQTHRHHKRRSRHQTLRGVSK
jgi:hypothetical protein